VQKLTCQIWNSALARHPVTKISLFEQRNQGLTLTKFLINPYFFNS